MSPRARARARAGTGPGARALPNPIPYPSVIVCHCGELATQQCTECDEALCAEGEPNCFSVINEDMTLCGAYTQWGCMMKITSCDNCDKFFAEDNLQETDEGMTLCDGCVMLVAA